MKITSLSKRLHWIKYKRILNRFVKKGCATDIQPFLKAMREYLHHVKPIH